MADIIDPAITVKIINSLPFLKTVSPSQHKEIEKLFVKSSYKSGDYIVKKGDVIDKIYYILHGQAQVNDIRDNKPVQISSLKAGDIIGVTSHGFFSVDGRRTANVIAITELQTINIEIAQLNDFLSNHPEVKKRTQETDDLIFKLDFIRRVAPFSNINNEALYNLARQVNSVNIKAGEYFFHQGDIANYCYLIESGQVNVVIDDGDKAKNVATLSKGDIFGEIALINNAQRNASTIAITDCQVVVINQKQLIDVLSSTKSVINPIVGVINECIRPKQLNNITCQISQTSEGQKIYVLHNQHNFSYYKLSEEDYYVWTELTGDNSLRDLVLKFHEKYQTFAAPKIQQLITDLSFFGFISGAPNQELFSGVDSGKTKFMMKIKQVMEFLYWFNNADVKMTSLYIKIGYLFFNKISYTIMLLLSALGFASFASYAILNDVQPLGTLAWYDYLLLYFTMSITLILYGLARACTTKHFGKNVSRFGVGILWLAPRVSVGTSDMWLCSAKQRVAVDISGLVVPLTLGGIAALMLWETDAKVNTMLWLFSCLNYLLVLFNTNPLLPTDGYYTLVDWLGKERLRQSALRWLATVIGKYKITEKEISHRAELLYWISVAAYLVVAATCSYFIQKALLEACGITLPYFALYLLLPLLVLVLALISVSAGLARIRPLLTK